MPSFRVELEIGRLRPGREPEQVMDAALASCGAHHMDAADVAVTRGIPKILVRFSVPASSTVEENESALATAARLRDAVGPIADAGRLLLLRRRHGSWLPVVQ